MAVVRSYRTRLQIAFVSIGLAAIALTAWEALAGASAALETAALVRLTAIRETKRLQIEDYFRDLSSHVLALSGDETASDALVAFRQGWRDIPSDPSPAEIQRLRAYYQGSFGERVQDELSGDEVLARWLPADPRQIILQDRFLAGNPYPVDSKDLLVDPANLGGYGPAHRRYHPTFHRYLNSFGFYDIFLIDALDGRALYTVFKEIDLGTSLRKAPFSNTILATAFERATKLDGPDEMVIVDYEPYIASYFAPAAMIAAPIRKAGVPIGVLAIQVSVENVNRMVTAGGAWRETGMGETGQAYIVGSDGTFRSDIRVELERADVFFEQLRNAGIDATLVSRVRKNGTAILSLHASKQVMSLIEKREAFTGSGVDFRGVEVLRSFAPLRVENLDWFVVAEMESAEAFAPLRAMQNRILLIGALIAFGFLAAAWFLGSAVTRPVLALLEGTRKLGSGDFRTRLDIRSDDEIGDLGKSFNLMADELERTTVSRAELDVANQQLRGQQAELEDLAARLIRAQEDERSRVARELHDDLTQRIAAVAIEIGKLERGLASDAEAALQARRIRESMARISTDVHRLSRSLHPSMLPELGLSTALEQEFRGFFERGGPPVEFTLSGDAARIPADLQLGVFRIVQEALHNALRHAAADEMTVSIRGEDDQLVLDIRDDGRGFDRSDASWRAGLGLASMRERAHLLGGSLQVESRPNDGTRLRATFPLRKGAA